MMKKIWGLVLSGIVLVISNDAKAQGYVESALTFSRTKPSGSARVLGLGGTQTALGGDYSSALSNPAGLGMFNRSEFTFSPAMTTQKNSSSFFGEGDEEITSRLNIPGLSVVFHLPKESGKFLGGSIGVSMTRVNDFNSNLIYHGENTETSIIDYFIDDATGFTTEQFDEGAYQYNRPTGLAYFNYLIGPTSILDPPGPETEYFTDVLSIPYQQEEIETRGAANQWSIAYGGNYDDKIFFGGGIGITTLRYKSKKFYTEDFPNDDPVFSALVLEENLNIRGSGINATLGITARPIDFVQVGISFTTPTLYQISESYDAAMSTQWESFDYYGDGTEILTNEEAATDIVTSEYNLTTPLKFSAGAAIIWEYGFVTGDIELTNPAKARYGSDTPGISYSSENDGIEATYQSTVNYRLGTEFRYEIFRLRLGYSHQANAFRDEIGDDNSVESISAGLGVRTKSFYVDFALVQSTWDSKYSPYSFIVFDLPNPVVDLESKVINGVVTVGFTF